MDQIFTVIILLGLTVGLASSLRKPAGASATSVNWGGAAPRSNGVEAGKLARPRKGWVVFTLLLALGLALALVGSHVAASSAGTSGATYSAAPALQACVNWNGYEWVDDGT